MPFIYIDRRNAGKGKSASNRQKLLKRIRGFIKNANPQSLGTGGVGQVYSAGRSANNPVKIAGSALEEPWFAYARGGDKLIVVPGNTDYERGDSIPVDSESESKGKGGPGDGGEDDFVINIASNEFLDLFFEDCELPNLDDEKVVENLENKMTHAGFSRQGTPAQLSVTRTYKQALGRRRALAGPHHRQIAELEEDLKNLLESMAENAEDDVICAEISEKMTVVERAIEVCRTKIAAIAGFDKVDLRFRNKEPHPLKQVDAVLVMVMDVSGSMDQEKKTIARRWFALLYAFIKRRYETTDLIFIAHTDEAFEMSEGDFFSTRINGGTMVSPALNKVNGILKERYNPAHTNIYVSHASDGDNWETDNGSVSDEMLNASGLMNKLQYFSYVEVGIGNAGWGSSSGSTSLWESYEQVHGKKPDKMSMAVLQAADDCYSVFKKIFRKK